MKRIKFYATLQPKPQKWTRVEIEFLIKLYPIYKSGNTKYNAAVLRGNLKNRSMAALSKKYWEIMGSEHKKKPELNQIRFDFSQHKIL